MNELHNSGFNALTGLAPFETNITASTPFQPLSSRTSLAKSKLQAFTLIELVVVIAIIALLVCMVLPAMAGTKLKTPSTQCLANLRQLQMAWTMYSEDNKDFLVGNHWQDQVSKVPNVGNWVSGCLDPRKNNSDNTNTSLLMDPNYGALGPYAKNAALYKCAASKVVVKEGTSFYPLARTVSMSSYMGFRTIPWSSGWRSFKKKSEIAPISPSSALVFLEEREDSIDDGELGVDMVNNIIPNAPAANHGGSGGLTFADGHAEMHRWRSKELQMPQQATAVMQFIPVPSNHIDMLWLRAHSTVRQ